jgi:hypothetical protein
MLSCLWEQLDRAAQANAPEREESHPGERGEHDTDKAKSPFLRGNLQAPVLASEPVPTPAPVAGDATGPLTLAGTEERHVDHGLPASKGRAHDAGALEPVVSDSSATSSRTSAESEANWCEWTRDAETARDLRILSAGDMTALES